MNRRHYKFWSLSWIFYARTPQSCQEQYLEEGNMKWIKIYMPKGQLNCSKRYIFTVKKYVEETAFHYHDAGLEHESEIALEHENEIALHHSQRQCLYTSHLYPQMCRASSHSHGKILK